MADNRPLLKEALLRAIAREQVMARQFALAVLERATEDGDAATIDWPAEVTRSRDLLLAQQHTVDTLKDCVARLPESQDTY